MQQARVVPLLAAESVVFRLPLRPSRLRWCRSVVARSFRPSQVPVCATSPRRPARSTRPTMPRTCHPTPKAAMRPTCVRPRARSSLLLRVVCTRSLSLSLSLSLSCSHSLGAVHRSRRPEAVQPRDARGQYAPLARGDRYREVRAADKQLFVCVTLSHIWTSLQPTEAIYAAQSGAHARLLPGDTAAAVRLAGCVRKVRHRHAVLHLLLPTGYLPTVPCGA